VSLGNDPTIPADRMVGRVCVPINPSLVSEFDPDAVPTVGDLLNELDRIPSDAGENEGKRRIEGRL